ncbi:hypothetical protein [Streptomyces tauricus]
MRAARPRPRRARVAQRQAAIITQQQLGDGATAKAHVGRLLTKLDARDRVQLVIMTYESGLVTPPRG